jgi:putative tryptophan/tyrosine transport system substrate-binding protein
MASHLGRRKFLATLGGAAVAWPIAARAQQPAMPVVGLLHPTSFDAVSSRLRAFHQGLKETGFVEGENVAIAYRFAENQIDQLPELAADLARRQVAVIVAVATPAAFAAKAATTTVPIVFVSPEDPVGLGLVASLARPDGNLTGINWFASELAAKRLELLRELVPGAARVALLVEPANVRITERTVRDVEAAARAMGLQIRVLNANTSREIDTAFATLASERPDALFVGSSSFFNARRVQLAHWATHHKVPATYTGREYVEAGGLMSYGASLPDAWRQVGAYAGRILKGAKPAELPVVQSTKLELVINAQTSRILGLEIPPTLLARADEVIE